MQKIYIDQINEYLGKKVHLFGWAQTVRDHKKVVFVDLRDSTGVVQVVGDSRLSKITPESVIKITGTVAKRPDHLINPKLPTGAVEVQMESVEVISPAATPPIPLDSDGLEIDEEIRLRYRYLDLRRERMLGNLKTRHKAISYIRNFLTQKGFLEIETPILTKTTPEGARDFIVPSRLQKGSFYALPQSPQQYKQLLMVSGVERYFQIARCFRDEDPRADRAYGEFTQLDLEMSFVSQEDILTLTEELFTSLVKEIFPHKKITQTPWPRISHADAQEKYKSDKPDLREDRHDKDELAFAWVLDYPLFTEQQTDDYFHGSGQAKYAPSHHMFTSPHPDDIKLLDTAPRKVRGLQHDLVLNGFEVGGGSIRIHDPKLQQKIFDLIGFSENQKKQFDHMLDAFKYGVPPHGGIAPGIDRFLMACLGEPSVREVIAFPASSGGKISVMDAPSPVVEDQLIELGLKVKK